MKLHEHEFSEVQDYLHHRPPYLMVDQIIEISGREVQTEKRITGDEFFIDGHFPGAAIVPGAMMQELTTQSAGILIAAKYNPMSEYNTHDPRFNPFALGVLVRMRNAKFKGFARPGDTLRCTVKLNEHTDTLFEFNAFVSVGENMIMRNTFRLANVESSLLYQTPDSAGSR